MNDHRWWLTSDRWAVAGAIALAGFIVSIIGHAWPEAGFFFVATVALLSVAAATRAKGEDEGARPGRRSVDNIDAGMAARSQHGGGVLGDVGAAPPGYVKDYDEGRPRK